MSRRVAFRLPIVSMIFPTNSSFMSRTISSSGSCLVPLIIFINTSGRDIQNSYPSRRIVSIRMVRCSSPLPETLKVSCVFVSSTRKETLDRTSLNKRSRSCLDVINSPSFPPKGDEFDEKYIARVGSSISITGNASGKSG